MLTEKTNKRLYWILLITGLAFVIGGIFPPLFFEGFEDLSWIITITGIPIAAIGDYFNSLTKDEDRDGGLSWGILLLAFLWMFKNIEHFTTPIIVGLVICGILVIVAFILTLKRWRRSRALEKERKEKEDQE